MIDRHRTGTGSRVGNLPGMKGDCFQTQLNFTDIPKILKLTGFLKIFPGFSEFFWGLGHSLKKNDFFVLIILFQRGRCAEEKDGI